MDQTNPSIHLVPKLLQFFWKVPYAKFHLISALSFGVHTQTSGWWNWFKIWLRSCKFDVRAIYHILLAAIWHYRVSKHKHRHTHRQTCRIWSKLIQIYCKGHFMSLIRANRNICGNTIIKPEITRVTDKIEWAIAETGNLDLRFKLILS